MDGGGGTGEAAAAASKQSDGNSKFPRVEIHEEEEKATANEIHLLSSGMRRVLEE